MNRIALSLVPVIALAGCSASTGDIEIATTPLSGTVGGQPWTFQAGETDAFLSEGEPDFFATAYASSYTPCGFSEPSGPHLIIAVPKEPGDYDLSLGRNMTFVDANQNNLVATEGRIVIDTVTATRVTGGLHGIYDDGNEVDGRFELTICAD